MAHPLRPSIELLVNNAGVGSTGSFDTTAAGRVSAVVDVNVQAVTQPRASSSLPCARWPGRMSSTFPV